MTELNFEEITTDGYFVKHPHDAESRDHHLRLAALIGVEPVSFDEATPGVYSAVYESPRDDVTKVVTTSSATRWLSSSVYRDDEVTLVWEEPEDVLHTARRWLGAPDDPNWSLVVDQEYLDNLRSNPGTVDETLDV